jgi:hypothetical protein
MMSPDGASARAAIPGRVEPAPASTSIDHSTPPLSSMAARSAVKTPLRFTSPARTAPPDDRETTATQVVWSASGTLSLRVQRGSPAGENRSTRMVEPKTRPG